jgi:putative lipoic acid-binding regulatory protein
MTSSDFIIENRESGNLRFFTNGSERARFTSGGKLFLGSTSAVRGSEDLSIQASSDAIVTRTASAGLIVRKTSFSNGFMCLFENDSATQVGAITSGGSSTVFNTSSDYRLKENIEPMQNGLERLNQLNPVKFSWKETGEESEGFIAHEVDEVFSDCIHGEKDGENMQGMDYGRITPLLVKAIQEQQEQIDALQSEIQSLKGE